MLVLVHWERPARHLSPNGAREPSSRQHKNNQLVVADNGKQPPSRVDDQLVNREGEVRALQRLELAGYIYLSTL